MRAYHVERSVAVPRLSGKHLRI